MTQPLRTVRYVLRGNFWTSPGFPSVPAPPTVVDPPPPPPVSPFLLNDPASLLNGSKVLV